MLTSNRGEHVNTEHGAQGDNVTTNHVELLYKIPKSQNINSINIERHGLFIYSIENSAVRTLQDVLYKFKYT